jgi:hypothetical protein
VYKYPHLDGREGRNRILGREKKYDVLQDAEEMVSALLQQPQAVDDAAGRRVENARVQIGLKTRPRLSVTSAEVYTLGPSAISEEKYGHLRLHSSLDSASWRIQIVA